MSGRMRAAAFLFASAWMAWVLGSAAAGARPPWLLAGWLRTTGPHVLVAGMVALAAWGFGEPLRRLLLRDVARDDASVRFLLGLALGFAVLEEAVLVLGLAGLLLRPVAMGLLGAGLLAAAHAGVRLARRGPLVLPAVEGAAWWISGGALLFPVLLMAGAPPLGPDEAQYHRRFVEHVLLTGGYACDPQDPLSGLGQGMHGLGALAGHVGGIYSVRPLALIMGLGGMVAGQRLTRRTFGPLAAGLYLPIVCGAASFLRGLPSLNTDLVGALFLGASALIVLDWSRTPEAPSGRAAALALLAGAAVGVKFIAPLFYAPFWIVLGALLVLRPTPGRGRALLVLVLSALGPLLMILPWLVRNQAAMGHPLFPILGMPIPEEFREAFQYNFTDNYGAGAGWRAAARTPWDLFVLAREYDRRLFLGRLNPWPLVALPGLPLALRGNRQAKVLAGIVLLGLAIWEWPLRRIVYLEPFWPLIASLAAAGLAALVSAVRGRARPMATALLAVVLVAEVAAEIAAPWADAIRDAEVACGTKDREEWEHERLPDARPVHWLQRNTEPGENVVFLWSWYGWGLPGRRLMWLGAEEHTSLRLELVQARTPEGLEERLRDLGVRWIVFRRIVFLRDRFPMVTDEQFERAFLQPVALVDETLARFATRRYTSGTSAIYELDGWDSQGAD